MARTRTAGGLLALALLGAATTACGLSEALGLRGPERYTAACAVLVDGSGSAAAAPEGFDGREKLRTALPDFLAERECRTLAFAPITAASQGSECQEPELEMDPDADSTDDRDQLREVRRVIAMEQAERLLDCAQERDPGSDVLGALARVADAAPADAEAYHVLVVSDFAQHDASFVLGSTDLSTPEARAEAMDGLAADGRLPQLPAGTVVYPAGYGMRYSDDPAAYDDFDAFWRELLQERGEADVDLAYRQ
ncbi:hypothetical protein RM780_18895 [Streptomyces sp. DSM 44917]|uniref:VWA domain-containing protein n=1 Tax=Streptomyces boetiae TaxID=3075541 RepID=A0ABU2LC15_9ACTN|nr:hypothetical protein [Streptomyces sp. DSM 44917]MDT0309011.1 hypothetical protein [Streptomyces sp. DSM 44917]